MITATKLVTKRHQVKSISEMPLTGNHVPVCPGNSRLTRTFPSLVFKLYIEQILSKPPQATKFPDGAYEHVMTQLDRRGMA